MSSAASMDVAVDRRLMDGPNSSIFLATDRRKNRQIVVKEIRIHRDRDHDDARQELMVAHKLRRAGPHPHVITYEAAFVQGDSLFLVMEACTRGDLHSLLESRPAQRLVEDEALQVWRQIVLGVQYLHANGIAHRDLSLENALVSDRGDIKICDFGLSAFTSHGQLSLGCVGKPYYMAPEVLTGEAYDAMLADLWSLGVVLFILLTGSPLVQTASPTDPALRSLERLGVAGILRHWGMHQDVSARTTSLLSRLLEPSPQKRLPSTRAILEYLSVDEA